MAKIDGLLKKICEIGASDVHLVSGSAPLIRFLGDLQPVKLPPLDWKVVQGLIFEILSPQQQKMFIATNDLDFSYELPGFGRFRGNLYRQRKGIDAVFRRIPSELPKLERLGFPDNVLRLTDLHQGLVLITGPTRSGKTTSIAAMVDYINEHDARNVITVEDPIEFVHPHKKSLINQREVGRSALTFAGSLRAALREDPDVIVVGEMRDLETMQLAVTAAETGHLVLSTMQTGSAHKTVDRIIDSFTPEQQNQIRIMLAESLKGVISQRLLKSSDGRSQVLASEILIGSNPLANMIRDGATFQIPNLIQTGKEWGNRTLDDSIEELLQKKRITARMAHYWANSKERFEKYLSAADQTKEKENRVVNG
ncbi:MAG: type IV pilus twitching motility protein PilT [bacterium]|nr:type IV pilus twitching motility protein PilT [bacterium]